MVLDLRQATRSHFVAAVINVYAEDLLAPWPQFGSDGKGTL